jgi:serine/threonine protein kinase
MFFTRDHARKGDEQYRKGNLQKAAELYLKAERFEQAAQMYEELGEIDRAVEIFQQQGLPLEAAELLEAHELYREAITFYERAGAYRRAAEASIRAGNYIRAARNFEEAGIFPRAAECFAKVGEVEHVVRAWESESRRLRAQRGDDRDPKLEKEIRESDIRRAEILGRFGRYGEAARLFHEHNLTDRAAPLFLKAGAHAEAARAYFDAGRIREALAAVEKAEDADDELRAEIYLNASRHQEAAELFERMERYDAAASAYEGAEAWAKAAEMWQKGGSPGRAAELFLRVDRVEAAGRCFAADGQPAKAAEVYLKAGLRRPAAEAYREAGNAYRAGEQFLADGDEDAAREQLLEVREGDAKYAEATLLLIPLLRDVGRIEEAQLRWDQVQRKRLPVPDHARLYIEGRLLESRGDYRQAEAVYRQVIVDNAEYGDAAERQRRLHRQIESGELPSRQQASRPRASRQRASGSRPGRSTGIRTGFDTAKVMKPSPAATGGREAAPSTPALTTVELGSDLPFKILEPLDPWWEGATFARVTDERDDGEKILVSFPLAILGDRADGFERAMREIAALDHPAILKLEEAIRASDKVLLLYEPFRGDTLDSLLARRRLPPLGAVQLASQLCEALDAAHKLGVSHQWLSPRTLLVDERGRAKLAGIGLRAILAERDDVAQAYLAPEVSDGGVVGPAADVFSLGLLAMELLRAQLPAERGRGGAIRAADVGWPEEVTELLSRPLLQTLAGTLDPKPTARPSTSELKAQLASIGLVPGQLLADRYEILDLLGEGGMSRVYRARDLRFEGDEVAIKTVLTPAVGRSEDEERLLQEVRICRRISHPNVVRVHDLGHFPGGIFVIMELLDGPRLDQVIQEEAPLPIGRVKGLLQEIATALAEAHRMKVIHRDLKPGNVMIADGRVKVLDFGIARLNDGSSASLTRTGQVVGSPLYMAPEQIQGKPLDGSCDLYALGVIAYTLLTGREPFLGETTTAIVLKHLHEAPPDVHELRPELSQEWVDLLAKLLAKEPEKRYRSAEEVISALSALPD